MRGYGLRRGSGSGEELAVGLGVGLAIPALAFLALLAAGQATVAEVASAGEEVTFWAALVPLVVYWAGVAIWEELVFRGVMLTNAAEGFARRLGPRRAVAAALVLTTVVFAGAHANQFAADDAPGALAAVLWLLLAGLLGLAYVAAGRLAAPIGIHLTVNAGLIFVFGIAGSRGEDFPALFRLEITGSKVIAGPGGVITIGAAALGTALFVLWSRARRGGLIHAESVAIARRARGP